MRRTIAILALVAVASLLGASDVQAFGLAPAGKTTGFALIATIVIDVTDGAATEGLTSIRVQRSSLSDAVFFTSQYVILNTWIECTSPGFDLQGSTQFRFVGKMNGWVPGPELSALLVRFGNPDKGAITDTDYAACTSVNGRKILSFTAVIQFEK